MKKLIAKFNLAILDGDLLFYRSSDEEIKYEFQIDSFEIKLLLNPDIRATQEFAQGGDTYFGSSNIRIEVSRDENIEPPPIEDFLGRNEYFSERGKSYIDVASKVLSRVILYFKFKLNNPRLNALTPSNDLGKPIWIDEKGNTLESMPHYITSTIPSPGPLGVKGLSIEDDLDFLHALQNPINPELYEELLSDSRTSIFEGNFRRGVLEMAIACEIFVKQSFFAESTVSGIAYEYLIDKRKVDVAVKELISKIAKQTFGESFKEYDEFAFNQIDSLFRCRNKVAHKGKSYFLTDNNEKIEVDFDILKDWWISVEKMINWLKDNLEKFSKNQK